MINATKSIVFMHGILGDERTWQPAFPSLPKEITAYSYTMTGFGEAGDEIPAEQFNTAQHANELIQYCRTFAPHKVTIIAWSYSCHVALLAALHAPELFEQLYLYDCMVPTYGLENCPDQLKLFSRDLHKMMSPVIKAIRQKDDQQIIDTFSAACSNQIQTVSQQSEWIQAIKKANAHTVSRLLTQAEPAKISKNALQNLSVPCGIYWGENSRPIFQLASQALYQSLPSHLRLKNSGAIPNADHLLPETAPNHFIQYIFNTAACDKKIFEILKIDL